MDEGDGTSPERGDACTESRTLCGATSEVERVRTEAEGADGVEVEAGERRVDERDSVVGTRGRVS